MKTVFFILAGACGGAGFMFAIFPLIVMCFVGPVHGEDQMSINAAVMLIGFPICVVAGAAVGFFIARRWRIQPRLE